ncbi:MAG: flagellar type III secretion system pore protein FliP [Pirellulaceae bacterium]|nr:flagellar type III secretion system pore protein FliP [Pirellulaceae bacterium]
MPERKRTTFIRAWLGCLTNCLARAKDNSPNGYRPERQRRVLASDARGRSALDQWRTSGSRCWLAWALVGTVCLSLFQPLAAQETVPLLQPAPSPGFLEQTQAGPGFLEKMQAGPKVWTSPEGLSSALQIMLLLTVLSMAPAILLMTTSFVRIIVVLGLLRQALGIQQLPPSQVITSIAMFMTLLIMTPVWTEVYDESIRPYTDPEIEMSLDEAWEAGTRPIRRFMSRQIIIAKNDDDVWLFYDYLPEESRTMSDEASDYADVPIQVLLPAFMLSELKTAFLIGFQIYLPFLILDIVVASVTISMGMLMLPPVMISLPFKLLLFVLVDGWRLVIGMLLESFAPYS